MPFASRMNVGERGRVRHRVLQRRELRLERRRVRRRRRCACASCACSGCELRLLASAVSALTFDAFGARRLQQEVVHHSASTSTPTRTPTSKVLGLHCFSAFT